MNCPRNCDYQLPYYEATSTDNFVRPIAPFLPSFLSVCMNVQVHISINYLSSIYSRLQWTHLMQTFSLASDLFLLSFIILSILSYMYIFHPYVLSIPGPKTSSPMDPSNRNYVHQLLLLRHHAEPIPPPHHHHHHHHHHHYS